MSINKIKDLAIIIKEFVSDLMNTFNDKIESNLNNDLNVIYLANKDLVFNIDVSCIEDIQDESVKEFYICVTNVKLYIEKVYPKHFLNILYQNNDIFTNINEPIYFLPNINFNEIFFDTTSQKTRETIWKYLQLIAFNNIQSIDDINSFGDTADMFKAIDSEDFKDKLKSSIDEITKLFSENYTDNADVCGNNIDISNNFANYFNNDMSFNFNNDMSFNFENNLNDISNSFKDFNSVFKNMFSNLGKNGDTSNNPIPDFNDIHNHINGLINGKIGSIAKELAQETAKDLELDENVTSPNDVFNKLLKDPNRLMSLVNNIGSKLDKKMKDGSINQSELLEEAQDIFKNMKNIPGMNNMESILKSMNLNNIIPPGSKFNNKAFESMMDSNIRMAKMRDRMNKKSQENMSKKEQQQEPQNESSIDNMFNIDTNTNDINKINENLSLLLKNIESSNQNINTNESTYIKKSNQVSNSEGNTTNRKKKNKNRKK